MLYWVRFIGLTAGAYLFLHAVAKTAWEWWSWGVLSNLGERPSSFELNPQLDWRPRMAIAAFGLAMFVLACLV